MIGQRGHIPRRACPHCVCLASTMNGRKWRNLERPVADPRRRIAAIGRARTEAAGVDPVCDDQFGQRERRNLPKSDSWVTSGRPAESAIIAAAGAANHTPVPADHSETIIGVIRPQSISDQRWTAVHQALFSFYQPHFCSAHKRVPHRHERRSRHLP